MGHSYPLYLTLFILNKYIFKYVNTRQPSLSNTMHSWKTHTRPGLRSMIFNIIAATMYVVLHKILTIEPVAID